MKKHVNLILQRQASSGPTEWMKRIRSAAVVLCVFFAIVIIIEILAVVFMQRKVANLENTKKVSSQYLLRNKELEQKIEFFLYKYNLLKTYLEDDAEVYSYYNLLLTLLTTIEVDATLTQFNMDSTNLANFSLTFDSYEDAIKFVDLVESPAFLNYFETLQLNNFAFNSSTTSYDLVLIGQFKAIENNENQ
ncbi:MAG: hypothetical protein ACEQSA_01795 [Weeksellaceae bacterium]